MTNSASISVVIPAYNRSKTILRCLDSIIKQTIHPLEIIVVDDCSTDNTLDLIRTYKNNLVKLISLKTNAGAQHARNEGIKAAKGEWIAFLDSDDEWMPDYLKQQLNIAIENKANVIYSGAYIYNGQNKQTYSMPDYTNHSYKQLLTKPGPMFQGLFVKKTCLQDINYLDEQVVAFQEWDTSIRLAKKNRFIFNPQPLFIYHLHPGDTISKSAKNDVIGYEYIVRKHKSDIIKIAGNTAFLNHLYKVQLKYFNLKEWKSWRRISFKILEFMKPEVSYLWYKKLTIHMSPAFYQRFQNYMTPLFTLKRIYFVFIKTLKTR